MDCVIKSRDYNGITETSLHCNSDWPEMGGDPHNLIGAKMIRSQDGRRGNEFFGGIIKATRKQR